LVDPNTRQGKRTPVTLKIKFKSETLEQFIERYAVDVSSGGIFIRTKEPLAVGTQMKFEFQLRDASPLIAGEGTVVWTRENDPSRPAIAPGMGVRFDRLADGSQGILERILSEKAKQAPQRPASETAKPPLFTDTPTRVAPAPMQEALLGKDNGRRRIDDSLHNDSHTPLPKPMPFHSDADEFPDEAFEEATKVRALDELIAQTAGNAPTPDEITQRRGNGRGDATGPEPKPERRRPSADSDSGAGTLPGRIERAEHRPTVLPPAEIVDVPDLPNPPELARPQPRLLDTSPSPRIESMPPPLPTHGKTQLGVEPARMRIPSPTPPPPVPAFTELPPVPSGMRAVAAEQTEPARMPPLRSRSIAPLLILIFVVVAAGGAAVWFFVLRPQTEPHTAGPGSEAPGSAVATPNPGPARTTAPAPGSAAAPIGSAGSSAPAPAGSNAPTAELADTVIASSVDGATVEISGTDQKGPAPFTAKLEKGKPYKARISARGYAVSEVDVKGGDARQTTTLVAKPRALMITTDPPGATISIDGGATGHTTPFEVTLNPAQGTKRVRVVLRRPGFRAVDRTIDLARFSEEDTRMVFKLDERMSPAPPPSRPPTVSRPSGQGSDAGSGAGSDAAPAGGSGQGTGGEGSAPTPPPPTPGPGAGSAEPEPEFNKKP